MMNILTVARSGPGNGTVQRLVTLLKNALPLREKVNGVDCYCKMIMVAQIYLLGGLAAGRVS